MRKIFSKAGYSLFLIDEYRTSKKCFNCKCSHSDKGECETFKKRNSSRPWRKDKIVDVHGLLKCNTCMQLWNRDVNASLNILKIATDEIFIGERPEYLKRNRLP